MNQGICIHQLSVVVAEVGYSVSAPICNQLNECYSVMATYMLGRLAFQYFVAVYTILALHLK